MEVNGEIPMDGYDSQSMAPLKQIISDFASAMSSDNITMKAMKDYFDGNVTKDKALDNFYKAAIEKYPNLSK